MEGDRPYQPLEDLKGLPEPNVQDEKIRNRVITITNNDYEMAGA
jgi:hypothetical protein